MSTYPLPRSSPRVTAETRVRSLLRLNEAVQKISSILELDLLLDTIVNDIAAAFGCLEACILLKDGDAGEVEVAAVMGCTECFKRDRFKIGIQGLTGYTAAVGMTVYTPDVTREPKYIACETGTRSELDIPLIAHGEVIGVFSAQHPEIDGFPAEQRALLEALAGHIAVAIENARVFQRERQERTRMSVQEKEAHAIQQRLFPRVAPQLPGFAIDGECLPAGAVGGDFYDYIALPDGKSWAMALGDVSGKGMAAALLMSATRGILRSISRTEQRPAEMLRALNHSLLDDLPAEKFVTMALAVLNPVQRTLTFANAGHPWPILAINGTASVLQSRSGLPLGISHSEYDETTVALPPGSRLVMFSDGLSEACARGGEEFGLERLKALAVQPDVSAAKLLAEVRTYCEERALVDDATAIVVRSTI